MRPAVVATLMLSMLALGSLAATSCGGRASAARSGSADPPLAPVEPAAVHAASLDVEAAVGGTIAVTDPTSPIDGARIELLPGALGADAAVTLDHLELTATGSRASTGKFSVCVSASAKSCKALIS